MIQFTESIVEILNECFAKNEEHVESVVMASYALSIQFVNFNVQGTERVFASIGGVAYEWHGAPNFGPWGALGRQLAKKTVLKTPSLLSIIFESGDFIDFETVESQYESVIFNFPPQGESSVMEIF